MALRTHPLSHLRFLRDKVQVREPSALLVEAVAVGWKGRMYPATHPIYLCYNQYMNEGFLPRFLNRWNRRGKKAGIEEKVEAPLSNMQMLLNLVPHANSFVIDQFNMLPDSSQEVILLDLRRKKEEELMDAKDIAARLESLVLNLTKMDDMNTEDSDKASRRRTNNRTTEEIKLDIEDKFNKKVARDFINESEYHIALEKLAKKKPN